MLRLLPVTAWLNSLVRKQGPRSPSRRRSNRPQLCRHAATPHLHHGLFHLSCKWHPAQACHWQINGGIPAQQQIVYVRAHRPQRVFLGRIGRFAEEISENGTGRTISVELLSGPHVYRAIPHGYRAASPGPYGHRAVLYCTM